jgi:DNA polymerase-3 subunit delta'
MARTLSKVLNCLSPQRSPNGVAIDCCDACLNCRKIEHQNHADVQWLRPESKSRIISIDQIRDLLQTVHLKPTEAEFKVAVIVGADRLKAEAANAFLKTLEEPPKRTVFILLTTEPQRLLETILSRCLRLTFAGEAMHRLQPGQLAWVQSFSEMAAAGQKGLLGRYRLLGSLMAHLTERREQIEQELTERSPLSRYDDLDPKQRERLEDELNAAIEAEHRRQRADVLAGLQWWLRDVWLLTLGNARDLAGFGNLTEAAQAVASRIGTQEALQNLQAMEDLQRLLQSNVQEALALEVGLLRLKL